MPVPTRQRLMQRRSCWRTRTRHMYALRANRARQRMLRTSTGMRMCRTAARHHKDSCQPCPRVADPYKHLCTQVRHAHAPDGAPAPKAVWVGHQAECVAEVAVTSGGCCTQGETPRRDMREEVSLLLTFKRSCRTTQPPPATTSPGKQGEKKTRPLLPWPVCPLQGQSRSPERRLPAHAGRATTPAIRCLERAAAKGGVGPACTFLPLPPASPPPTPRYS